MFNYDVVSALNNLFFVKEAYSLGNGLVCADADVMDIIVTNKNDLEMSLTVSQGNKTLFTKYYDLNNIDVMIEDLEKHHMVLV